MEDQHELKALYEAATDAYLRISERNMQRALAGSHPSVEALQSEAEAEEQLRVARHAYMEVLRTRT